MSIFSNNIFIIYTFYIIKSYAFLLALSQLGKTSHLNSGFFARCPFESKIYCHLMMRWWINLTFGGWDELHEYNINSYKPLYNLSPYCISWKKISVKFFDPKQFMTSLKSLQELSQCLLLSRSKSKVYL